MSGFKLDTKKLMKKIEQQTTNELYKRKYDVKCPHCNKQVRIPTGKSKCIHCGKPIDLDLGINFK